MKYSDKERWAVDVEVLDFSRTLPFERYQREIRDALTANGNFGVVDFDDEYPLNDYARLSIWGDANGGNERIKVLFKELEKLGCQFEYPESMSDEDYQEMHKLCGA